MIRRKTPVDPERHVRIEWPTYWAISSNGIAGTPDESVASYLPQIAGGLPEVTDGLAGIPEALRGTELVTVGQVVFLRSWNREPEWWDAAHSGAIRFPQSRHLRVLRAFAVVDRVCRDDNAQRLFEPSDEQRSELREAADTLDEDWSAKSTVLRNPYDDGAVALASAMMAWRFLHERERALARADRIADEGLDEPQLITNAIQVAFDVPGRRPGPPPCAARDGGRRGGVPGGRDRASGRRLARGRRLLRQGGDPAA